MTKNDDGVPQPWKAQYYTTFKNGPPDELHGKYPTATSIDTGFEPLSLNSNSTPRFSSQMAYGDEDGDSGRQQSPEDNESPRNNAQRPLRRCRFACHFHKYSPSLYCAANYDERYKWCEKPGWESLAAVRNHLHYLHRNISSGPTHCHVSGTNLEEEPSIVSSEQYAIIDQDQWTSISNLDISDETQDEQTWFDIWYIIFPETPFPVTPWHEAELYKHESMFSENSHTSSFSESLASHRESDLVLSQSRFGIGESNTGFETALLMSTSSSTESMDTVDHYEVLRAGFADSSFVDYRPSFIETDFLPLLSTDILPWPSDSTKCHLMVDSDSTCNEGICIDYATAFGWTTSEQFNLHLPAYPIELLTGTGSPTAGTKLSLAVADQASLSTSENLNCHKESEEEFEALIPCPDNEVSRNLQVSNLEAGSTATEFEAINIITDYDDQDNEMSDADNDLASAEIWVLREALSDDPEFFARALPLFQAEWDRRNTTNSPGAYLTSHGDSPQTAGTPSGQILSADNPKIEQRRKRKLPNDNRQEDDEDDDQEPNPKRPKPTPDSEKPSEERRFGCPFHKMNPMVYCAASTAGRMERNKWKMCGMPSSDRLRSLIDDHLFKKHRIYDCTDCGREFDDPAAKHDHDFHGCPQKGSKNFKGPYREGITTADVDKIKTIQKDSRSRPPEKWMEIFQLIFPHKKLPSSPYYNEGDDPNLRPISTPEIEDLLRRLLHFNQTAIAAGEMSPIDQKTYEKLVDNLRLSIKASNIKAGSNTPSSMLTPSSTGMAASTQSVMERLSQEGTPFSQGTQFSRTGFSSRDQIASDSHLIPNRPRRWESVVPDMPLDHASMSSPSPCVESQPTYFRQPSQAIGGTTSQSLNCYAQDSLTQNWLQETQTPADNSFRNIATSRAYEPAWQAPVPMERINNVTAHNAPQDSSALTQIMRRLEAAEQETRALRHLIRSPPSGQENGTFPAFQAGVQMAGSGRSTPNRARKITDMTQSGKPQQHQTSQHFAKPNHVSEQPYGHQHHQQQYQQDLSPGIYRTPSNQGLASRNNSGSWANTPNPIGMPQEHASHLPAFDPTEMSNEDLTKLLEDPAFMNTTGNMTIIQHSEDPGIHQDFEG